MFPSKLTFYLLKQLYIYPQSNHNYVLIAPCVSFSLKYFIFASKNVFKSIHFAILTLETSIPSIVKHNGSHLFFSSQCMVFYVSVDIIFSTFSHSPFIDTYFYPNRPSFYTQHPPKSIVISLISTPNANDVIFLHIDLDISFPNLFS